MTRLSAPPALSAWTLALSLIVHPAAAQDTIQSGGVAVTSEDAAEIYTESYSPYGGRGFPTQVFWGDTHLHTSNSLDAKAGGVLLGPAEAYRFARGEEVRSTHGEPVKLSRPLDFLVVSDHSDAMGAMKEIGTARTSPAGCCPTPPPRASTPRTCCRVPWATPIVKSEE